jgi:hypothetical protein
MSTSDKIQSILEMLLTWGMEGIDEKDTQPKDIFTAFGQEAWKRSCITKMNYQKDGQELAKTRPDVDLRKF